MQITYEDLEEDLFNLKHMKNNFLKLVQSFPKDPDYRQSLNAVNRAITDKERQIKRYSIINTIYNNFQKKLERNYYS
jgi:hypothetical protein